MSKCTAKSKRSGERCRNYPLKGYSVCRFHGARGGSKTSEGRRKQSEANIKHGLYTSEAIKERRAFSKALKEHRDAIRGHVNH